MHNLRTLNEWLKFIESAHIQDIDMGLERVRNVYNRLALDFSSKCVISVAGTNGKGTTCRFIEQASLLANKRVGVYASPHIEQFNERIRLDGIDVTDANLCAAFAQVYNAANGNRSQNEKPITLTYFEYATLCALYLFAHSDIDICILEVGLGGRLDATNILDANIGIITSIGLDHQSYLGNTTEAIAGEKAGIIKAAQQVVIGYENMHETVKAVLETFSNRALLCGEDFGITHMHAGIIGWIDINGTLQKFSLVKAKIPPQNIMTSIATLKLIAEYFQSPQPLLLPVTTIDSLIEKVGLAGRFETINQAPLIILDVAHNEDSAEYLVTKMQQQDYNNCHIVIGMLKDKNIEGTIARLSLLNAKWYCVDLPTPRGEKSHRLATAVDKYQQKHLQFEKVSSALQQAVDDHRTNDIILIVGSFVLASLCLQELKQIINNKVNNFQ
jgi:dihydrofolate synthase/folylpolyglutamate synthase